MPKLLLAVIVIGIIAFGGYYLMGNQQYAPVTEEVMVTETTQNPSEMMAEKSIITLSEQNSSGEMGTATLTEEDGKTKVTLEMQGGADGVPQPAHIHVGACPDVGAVAYPLTNVVDGKSETILDVTLGELSVKQPLGINVHKSGAEAKVYVSCGDLNLPTDTPASPGQMMQKNY